MTKDVRYNNIVYRVNHPGKIVRANINHYLDQLSDGKLIFTRSLNKYFTNNYGISIEEYFNIVVNNGIYPVCKSCGSKAEFTNLLKGYSDICPECGRHIEVPKIEKIDGTCECCGKDIQDTDLNKKICNECRGMNYDPSDFSFVLVNGFKIYHSGVIAKASSNEYLDQIDNSTIIHNLKNFLEYLIDKYNLSEREYYNLVVHNDIGYNHVCENNECSNLTEFLGLNLGYKRFCSNKCGMSSRGDLSKNFKSYYDRLNETIEIRGKDNKRKKIFTKMTKSEIISLMYHGYKCYSGKYGSRYSKSYLYYSEFKYDDSVFKIGISVNPEDRWSKAKYINCKILAEGTVEYISNLEFMIKKKFIDRLVLESEYPTETFRKESYNEITEYINEIIKSDITL